MVAQPLFRLGAGEVVAAGGVAAPLGYQAVGQRVGLVPAVVAVSLNLPLVVDVGDGDGALVDPEGVCDELLVVLRGDPGDAQSGADALLDARGQHLAQRGDVRAVAVVGFGDGLGFGKLHPDVAGEVAGARNPGGGVFGGPEREGVVLELGLDLVGLCVEQLGDALDVDRGALVHAQCEGVVDGVCVLGRPCRFEHVGGEHRRFARDHALFVE